MQPGFDIDKLDYSVLTDRSLSEIAGDEGSAEWESNRKAGRSKGTVRKGAEWLLGSGDRKTQKQKQEVKATKSGVDRKPTLSAKNTERVGHPRNSPSTPRKKTSVKKKTRKAA